MTAVRSHVRGPAAPVAAVADQAAAEELAVVRPETAPEQAPRRRPDLRVVPAPRRRRLRHLTRILTVVTIAGFFGVLFGLAAFHAALAQGQYELGELEDRLEVLAHQRVELELTAQELESPDRVATIAREMLGLVSPERTEDLYPSAADAADVLDAGTSVGTGEAP